MFFSHNERFQPQKSTKVQKRKKAKSKKLIKYILCFVCLFVAK